MLRLKSIVPFISISLALSAPTWAQTGPPGKINFLRVSNASLDPYTGPNSTAIQQDWLQTHFGRIVVFSPYFDSDTSWYPNGLVYQDLYAIYTNSALVTQHPEWILHDQNGNRLYIPWGCSNGTCPQYAADVANPDFRAWWIGQMQGVLSHNYRGMFVDDVNMNFSVSDGNGNAVAPIDDSTGAPMTWTAWRYYIAQFVMQIRQAFPNKEIVHNAVWFAGPAGVKDQDPAIQLQISAADIINLERGVGSDTGLTGGTGEFSVYSLFSFIDRVHQTGHAGVLQQYNVTDVPTQQYSLAAYYMISSGRDYYGDTSTTQDNWWSGFDTSLGAPLGPRTYNNGIFQRNFTNGIALLADPGTQTQTIALPGTYQTVDGQSVTSVTLSAKQGAVLIGPLTAPGTPTLPTPALSLDVTSIPAATAGAFYTTGMHASGGSGIYSFAVSGAPAGIDISGWNLSGTPSAAGSYNPLITVTDTASGATAQRAVTLPVNQQLSVTTTTLPTGAVGMSYSTAVSAAGGSSAYRWSVVNQPAPLVLNGSTLSGKPTAASNSPAVTFTVMDTSSGVSTQKTLALSVLTDPSITNTALPTAIVSVAYSATLSASGGSGTYSWSATSLPTGLSLSGNVIRGTPTKTGTWSTVVTVTDTITRATSTKTFSVKVATKSGR